MKLLAFHFPLSIFDRCNCLYHPSIPTLILLKQDVELAEGHSGSPMQISLSRPGEVVRRAVGRSRIPNLPGPPPWAYGYLHLLFYAVLSTWGLCFKVWTGFDVEQRQNLVAKTSLGENLCAEWHSALGSLSGNYFTDREFRMSSLFESNLSLLWFLFVWFWLLVFGVWFDLVFCCWFGRWFNVSFPPSLITTQATSIGHMCCTI